MNEFTDKIICGKFAEICRNIPDEFIDVIITSPPYGANIAYDSCADDIHVAVRNVDGVLAAASRILTKSGRLCINLPCDTGVGGFLPLAFEAMGQVKKYPNLQLHSNIFWYFGQATAKTSWGSWQSPSSPHIRSICEFIMIFQKGTDPKQPRDGQSSPDISSQEFMAWTRSVWEIHPESRTKGHPATFPYVLPARLIKLYSYPGDLIYDPFCGSGTTLVAAKRHNRLYLGTDISKKYCGLSEQNLTAEQPSFL